MRTQRFFLTLVKAFILFFCSSTLLSCANSFQLERSCGFGFDMRYDNQHAAVLGFRLSGEKNEIAATPPTNPDNGHKYYADGIGFQYDRPTALYVKWQDENSGIIYEKNVDLRHALPRDLQHGILYFIVHGPEISVYLARLDKDVAVESKIGSTVYRYKLNLKIYP